MNQFSNQYNLGVRTSQFALDVIGLCQAARLNPISTPIITQLVKSATSIGANYAEANAASSKKDFANKIFICKKEAQETKYWFKMLEKCFPELSSDIPKLEQECQELIMIFQKITSTLRAKTEGGAATK